MAIASMLAASIVSIIPQQFLLIVILLLFPSVKYRVGRYGIGWPRLFLLCLLLSSTTGFFAGPPPVYVTWRNTVIASWKAGLCNGALNKLLQEFDGNTAISSSSNTPEVTKLADPYLAVSDRTNRWTKDFKCLDEKLTELELRTAELTERFARDAAVRAAINDTLQTIEKTLKMTDFKIRSNKMLLLISQFACAMQFALSSQFPTLVKPSGSLTFAALQRKVRRSGSQSDKERFRLIVKEFKFNGILAGEIDDALYELREVGSEITFPVTLRDANGEIHATVESLSEAIASAAPVEDELRSLATCMLPVYLQYRDPSRPLLSCALADL
eukprot:gene24117-27287_t